MYEKLLYRKIKYVPIAVIQQCVADAAKTRLDLMLIPDGNLGARSQALVGARQISMTLCLKYTKHTLAVIGKHHGNRDHATVLHAKKTVNNLVDVKDQSVLQNLRASEANIMQWYGKQIRVIDIDSKIKSQMIKTWIRNKVPLYVREKLILQYGRVCKECGQFNLK